MTGLYAFAMLGTLFAAMLAGFWIIVTARTVEGAYHGDLFVAPCLSDGTGLASPPAATLTAAAL